MALHDLVRNKLQYKDVDPWNDAKENAKAPEAKEAEAKAEEKKDDKAAPKKA